MSIISRLIGEGVVVLYHDYRSGSAKDISGNGNDGTISGSAWYSQLGLQLDGTSGYVNVSDDASLNFISGGVDTGHSTLFFATPKTTAFFRMFGKGIFLSGGEYNTYLDNSSMFKHWIADDSEGAYIGRTTPDISARQDESIVFVSTYSGTPPSSGVNLYIDGVDADTGNFELTPGSYSEMEAGGQDLRIGEFNTVESNGIIHAAMLFSRELTSSEVAQLTAEIRDLKWDDNTYYKNEDDDIQFLGGMGTSDTVGGITSGPISESPIIVNSGGFEFKTEVINNVRCKIIECNISGRFHIPFQKYSPTDTDAGEGDWEFWIYHANASLTDVNFIQVNSNNLSTLGNYGLRINSVEAVSLVKRGAATLMASAASYISHSTWHGYRITRDAASSFLIQVKGGAYADWTNVDTAGGSGTNPVTDGFGQVSTYMLFDVDVGDKIVWSSDTGAYAFKKGKL